MSEDRVKSGWTSDEDELLLRAVKEARDEGRPLKSVFDKVALLTGRKPNSIRNYYYVRAKDDSLKDILVGTSTAFVPFTKEEVRAMMKTILSQQAKGVSVRSCTLRMGNNDTSLMLRYQNKYRSVIRSDPKLVKEIISELEASGIPAFDPYQKVQGKRLGRPKKSQMTADSLIDTVAQTVSDLGSVEGLDVSVLFECLGALAVSAKKGIDSRSKIMIGTDAMQLSHLLDENTELRNAIATFEDEIRQKNERFTKLMGMFRQLMEVNREFLELTGVMKVSSLGTYIRELTGNVEKCERLMVEYIR